MDVLKKLLLKALEMVEAGDCDHISPDDVEKLSILIHPVETVGREHAAKFLGVSLNRFHELRDEGIIKPPRVVAGLKEKQYYMSDLKKAKERLRK